MVDIIMPYGLILRDIPVIDKDAEWVDLARITDTPVTYPITLEFVGLTEEQMSWII